MSSTTITVKTNKDIAHDLQEFFIGTYADKALQAALDSGNEDLLNIAVAEYGSLRENIEVEERNRVENDCF